MPSASHAGRRLEDVAMTRLIAAGALALVVAAAWLAGASLSAEQTDGPRLAQPRRESPDVEAPPAPPPAAPEKKPDAESAAPKAPGAEKAAPPAAGGVTPPPPLPDVDIPAIPEVDQDPFKPGLPPKRVATGTIEEGKRLFNREGRISTDPVGRTVFVFDSADKPMELLENSSREYLETVTDYGKKDARWRVSGVVTVYGGRNFLLLTRVQRMQPEEEGL
jgi:hypothetical protein